MNLTFENYRLDIYHYSNFIKFTTGDKMEKKKILIVEDELVIALDIKYTLESEGYDVIDIVATSEEAIKSIKEIKPDLLLMDIILEGPQNGIELTKMIQKEYNIPVLYITALIDNKTYEDAEKTKPICYLVKPYRDKELVTWVDKAFK